MDKETLRKSCNVLFITLLKLATKFIMVEATVECINSVLYYEQKRSCNGKCNYSYVRYFFKTHERFDGSTGNKNCNGFPY